MKAKAEKVFSWCEPERAHKYADHMAVCSRACCGNPRKWFKQKTKQEIIAEKKLKDE
jgi:hypothetical protein